MTRQAKAVTLAQLDNPPTFEDYVAARRVVLFIAAELRAEKYHGKLNIASDEMIARIVTRSCERLNGDSRHDG